MSPRNTLLYRRFIVLPRALWPRLAVLMLMATGPMVAVLVLSAMADGRRVVEAAGEQVVQMARLAAEQQDDALQEAISLLHVLARVGAVQEQQEGGCGDLLRNVAADHPRIDALAVAGRDGTVVCGSRPGAKGLNVADRPYFREVMADDGASAVISNLTISRLSGKLTVFVVVPIRAGGVKTGAVIASLNLAWFVHLGERLPYGRDELLQVLDSRDGSIIARAPDRSAMIGQAVPAHPVLQALRDSPMGGSVVAPDLDGTRRIFGFAPLPGRGSSIVVAVGLLEAEVRREADLRSGYALAVALGAVAFAVLAAWLPGCRRSTRCCVRYAAWRWRRGRWAAGTCRPMRRWDAARRRNCARLPPHSPAWPGACVSGTTASPAWDGSSPPARRITVCWRTPRRT